MLDKSKYQSASIDTDRMWQEKGVELEVGASIEGRYLSKRENVGAHDSMLYVLETDNGDKVGVWGGTVIDNGMQGIAFGKIVGIEYLGKKESKNGGTYKDFFVGSGIDTVGDEKAPF